MASSGCARLKVTAYECRRTVKSERKGIGTEMPQYFFDLDDGKTDYFDTIGTDISDPGQLRSEAVRFLASVFRDAARDIDDRVILASVRDEAGRIVLTTTLTLQSDWRDARYRAGTTTVNRDRDDQRERIRRC